MMILQIRRHLIHLKLDNTEDEAKQLKLVKQLKRRVIGPDPDVSRAYIDTSGE